MYPKIQIHIGKKEATLEYTPIKTHIYTTIS